jgi:hypothetical protein
LGLDLVTVDAAPTLWPSALFADLAEASSFFKDSLHGYSATRRDVFDGVALSTDAWQVTAARVTRRGLAPIQAAEPSVVALLV